MEEDDLYEILNLSPRAEPEVVVAAYRALASKYRPDKARDRATAEQRMMLLNRAYEVLNDPERREEYDRRKAGKPSWRSGKVVPAPPQYGGRWGRARLRDEKARDYEAVVQAIEEHGAQVRCTAALNPRQEPLLVLSMGQNVAPLVLKVKIAFQRGDIYDLRFGPLPEPARQLLATFIANRV